MKILKTLGLLALLYGQLGQADFYQTAMDKVSWKFSGDKGNCSLTQDIPLYGSAEFVSKSGQPLRFSIQEQRRKAPIIKASLAAMPAPWMREALADKNYQVYLENADGHGFGRLSVYSEAAEAMLDVLLQGQYPTFSYIRAGSSLDVQETRVAVSSIKFAAKYKEFLDCRNQSGAVAMANNLAINSSRKKRRS